MCKLYGMNSRFFKKFKEININFLIIFFNRNCIGIFKFIVEVKIIFDVYNNVYVFLDL